HDAPHARIDLRDIVCPAGFEQDSEAVIAKSFHQRQRSFLKQWLAASQLDQGEASVECRVSSEIVPNSPLAPRPSPPEWLGQPLDLGAHVRHGSLFAFGEGVRGIAIRTAQIAGS